MHYKEFDFIYPCDVDVMGPSAPTSSCRKAEHGEGVSFIRPGVIKKHIKSIFR